MRPFVILLLSAIIGMIGIKVTARDYDYLVNGIAYKVDNVTHKAEVTYTASFGGNRHDYIGDIVIPDSICDYYEVNRIGNDAFNGCHELTSIALPNTITTIGVTAFWRCTSLRSFVLPKSVIEVGMGVLSGCPNLSSIIVENGNLFYDSRSNCNAIIEKSTQKLIAGCGTTKIPDGVEIIGNSAFLGSSFSYISIPGSVTSIEYMAFGECDSLSSIYIPKSVTSIGSAVFQPGYEGSNNLRTIIVDSWNPVYTSWSNSNAIIEKATKTLIAGCDKTIIPDGVECIGADAFTSCNKMTKITIPESVSSIEATFSSCSSLRTVHVKSDIPISISDSHFKNRSNMTLIVPRGCTAIYNAADFWSDFGRIVEEPVEFVDDVVKEICIANWDTNKDGELSYDEAAAVTDIGELFGNSQINSFDELQFFTGLAYIHEWAFANCTSLTSIIIPENVKTIKRWAFHNTGINTIPSRPISIEDNAFNSCTKIEFVSLPAGMEYISVGLFYRCYELKSVFVPKTIERVDSLAFGYCNGLTSIEVDKENPYYDSRDGCNAIIETTTNKLVIGCKNTVIPESVDLIDDKAYWGIDLTEVTVRRKSPITITESTFFRRQNATLIVPHGCKAAYEAAEYWNEFKEIVEEQEPFIDFADTNVKSICVSNWDTDGDGELSFDEAAAVTSLKNVFTNKKNIQSFDELQYFTGLKSINLMAFSSCSELTSIRIPENVTNIALSAFSTCTKLASVNIPESVTSIGTNAFYQCTSLSSITIPKNVNSISNNCFAGCSQLASITVDAENVVFDSRGNCNAIINKENSSLIAGCKNTTIQESVTDIASDAFRECTALLSITIPEGVRSIGSKAFDGCSALISVTINQPEPISISSTTFSNSVNATLYVPYKSKSVYASTDFWQDFKAIVEMPPTVFTLSDGQSFSNDEEIFVERLNYSRTFKNTNWQAWYVPFDVTLTSEILAHFAFAEFAGTYAEEDGSFYITVVRLKEGDVVKANTPYCVQAKVADSSNPQVISQTDVILKTSTVNSFYVLSARKRITFFGNYTHRTVTAEDENLYALSGGRYSKQQPGNTLAPYRCFFTIEDREDNPYATAPNPSEVKLMVIGEDDTFISELDFDNEVGPTVYDLNGRKVNRQKTTHGIYIINGKKVIIK